MESNTLKEHRQNIAKIKSSFTNPALPEEAAVWNIHAFLVRLLVAVVLFGAFVFCDKNQVACRGYTVETVTEAIVETVTMDKIFK